jgi:hypothetical protein
MIHAVMYRGRIIGIAVAIATALVPALAQAQVARTNVNRNVNVNRASNVNVSSSSNVNVNRNVNVDVDNRNVYHPVAAAAVVTAGVAATAAAIGSVAYALPPACSAVVVYGVTYQQCGTTWYQPQYAGTQMTYVVVNPPQ